MKLRNSTLDEQVFFEENSNNMGLSDESGKHGCTDGLATKWKIGEATSSLIKDALKDK